MKIILYIFATIGVIGSLYLALSYGVTKSERVECIKWEKQASESRIFEATDWQVAQCKQFNINL